MSLIISKLTRSSSKWSKLGYVSTCDNTNDQVNRFPAKSSCHPVSLLNVERAAALIKVAVRDTELLLTRFIGAAFCMRMDCAKIKRFY